jgi:hypothetical protein
MAGPKPIRIDLSETESQELQKLVHRHNVGQQIALRGRIILNIHQSESLVRYVAEEKVLSFVNYYNKTMAKPFKWTYQGKALTV